MTAALPPSAPVPPGPRAPRGRPRSEASRRAVLDAAKVLLGVRRVRDITIDALARESGVGRPTIYRWWPGATAVVLDAFLEDVSATFTPPPGRVTAGVALERQVLGIVRVLRGPQGRVIAELLAEGQGHPELLALFRDRFLFVRRQVVRAILERGIQSGEFAPGIDVDFVIDLMTGPAYLRLLTGHQPISESFARQLAAHVLRSIARARPRARTNAR